MLPWSQRGSSWYVQTPKGSAIIHPAKDDTFVVDMWAPTQESIATGRFPTLQAAQKRVEAALDTRNTAWDRILADPPEDPYCGQCPECRLAVIGCGCDGAYDNTGCWLCNPTKHQRPPCPTEKPAPSV